MADHRQIVLVVEDEPLLRLMAVDLVEEAGFDALEAVGAEEAVRILEGRADVRVVFTDIDMPGGMNGLTLAASIRERWPPIDVILTSGKVKPASGEIPARGVFFPKPYRRGEVAAALHRMAA